MAIPHAQPGELIDVRPLGAKLAEQQTLTLAKTEAFEMIRLVLPKGKQLGTHQAPGEIHFHCLEGRVTLTAADKNIDVAAGQLVYLQAREPHSVTSHEDSSVLLTILFPGRAS